MTLADQEARDRIQEGLDVTLVVEAAAGTGKTTALVRRILELIRTGNARLSGIVAVTFTDKAAAEMKLRLREAIEGARRAAPASERALLDGALRELEAARIATIHSLCQDLLRERPVEAGIDPLFSVAAEAEAQRLFRGAFDQWFEEVLGDPPEGVRRVLRRRTWGQDRPRDQLRSAAWRLAEQRDFETGWRRDPFDREAAIDGVMDSLGVVGALSERASDPDDYLARSVAEIGHWCAELAHRESVRDRDYDGLEAELSAFARRRHWVWKGRGRWFGDGLPRAEVLALRERAKTDLDVVTASCGQDLAPCLAEALHPVVERYEQVKARAGVLDFFDLLHRTHALLMEDQDVRRDQQQRISHLLVDEFQDTDPLQADILLLLASSDPTVSDPRDVRVRPGKLFIVGDPKQSIYRFRRADVVLYEALKRRLLSDGAELVELSSSFRSDPRIQEAVNVAFASRMRGDGQAHYVPLDPVRSPVDARPAVIALPVPDPYNDWGAIKDWPVKRSFPEAVGAFVKWLVAESGWQVTDPATRELTSVAPRHVCLLFRRLQSFGVPVTDAYSRALEARDVPHVLTGGRAFHEREEVLAMRNAATAVEWPDDELAVYATLRGPLFAVGDDALLAWKDRFGSVHPLRPIEDVPDTGLWAEVLAPLQILARLHRSRNRRPFVDTVTELLEAARAHAGFAFWAGGEQVLGNVLRMVELARRAEASGLSSFRAFMEELLDDAERGQAPQAVMVEDGTEGVRVMTVHKAKGLEFPVVILCDPTCNAVGRKPNRWVDNDSRRCFESLAGCVPVELEENAGEVLRRDEEEAHRLLYVAATRARDLLVIPAIGDVAATEPDWWTAPLDPAVFPPESARRHGAPAPGCPPFGADTVRVRPPRARPDVVAVQPGAHEGVGGSGVVWWDPYALELDVSGASGLRYQTVLADDSGSGEAAASKERYEEWRSRRAAVLERGGRPSVTVVTPTQLAAESPSLSSDRVLVQSTDAIRAARPAGRRFGTLVHEALEYVAAEAGADLVARTVRWRGRVLGASEEEVAAATEAVLAALAHPIMEAAARSPDSRREAALAWVLDDGTVVEGGADLVFLDPDDPRRWIVVDFKTSADEAESRDRWLAQVSCYCDAVEAATEVRAEGVVLMV